MNGVLFVVLVATIDEVLAWFERYPSLCLFDFHSSVSVDFTMLSVHLLGVSLLIPLIFMYICMQKKVFPVLQ